MPASLESEPPALEFRLLGTCEIRVHGRPLPPPRYHKEWWLLALLVLRHDRDSSRDALADAFWPDSDGDRALLYLRRSLTNLRRALGPEAARLLSPSPRTLRLDLSGAFADVLAFDQALKSLSAGSVPTARLEEAVALYAGPFLPDCSDEWVLPEREARVQAYLAALEGLAEGAVARGDPSEAVPWLCRLIAADSLRESAHAALMRALAAGGDRAAAAQVFRDLRQTLRERLNTDAAPETRELHRRLTEQDAVSLVPPPLATPVLSRRHLPIPLPDLIGRMGEIEEVTGWLRRCRLVTLLGAGGAGKTRLAISAAEAALPQFEAGVWFVDLASLSAPALVSEAVAKTLGVGEEAGHSLEEGLAEALSSASLLLVLDNCEHAARSARRTRFKEARRPCRRPKRQPSHRRGLPWAERRSRQLGLRAKRFHWNKPPQMPWGAAGADAPCPTPQGAVGLRWTAKQGKIALVTAIPQPSLTLVTGRVLYRPRAGKADPLSLVEAAIAGGVNIVQLRVRNASVDDLGLYAVALRLREMTAGQAQFIVTGDLELAEKCGADGVLLTERAYKPAEARRFLRPSGEATVGSFAHTVTGAARAERGGADYVQVGPAFDADAPGEGLALMRKIKDAVHIPVVAFGGIQTPADVADCLRAGADGVAVTQAVTEAPDPQRAAADLRAALEAAWRVLHGA